MFAGGGGKTGEGDDEFNLEAPQGQRSTANNKGVVKNLPGPCAMSIVHLTPPAHGKHTITVPMPDDASIASYPIRRHQVGSDRGEEQEVT